MSTTISSTSSAPIPNAPILESGIGSRTYNYMNPLNANKFINDVEIIMDGYSTRLYTTKRILAENCSYFEEYFSKLNVVSDDWCELKNNDRPLGAPKLIRQHALYLMNNVDKPCKPYIPSNPLMSINHKDSYTVIRLHKSLNVVPCIMETILCMFGKQNASTFTVQGAMVSFRLLEMWSFKTMDSFKTIVINIVKNSVSATKPSNLYLYIRLMINYANENELHTFVSYQLRNSNYQEFMKSLNRLSPSQKDRILQIVCCVAISEIRRY